MKPLVCTMLSALLLSGCGADNNGNKSTSDLEEKRRIDELISKLKDGKTYDDLNVIKKLHLMGPKADPAIPALVDVMRRKTNNSRNPTRTAEQAARVLARISPAGLAAVIDDISHERAEVRQRAIDAIPRSPKGKPAVHALSKRLYDSNTGIRMTAAQVLRDIGPGAKNALPDLREALEKEWHRSVREEMTDAIRRISK